MLESRPPANLPDVPYATPAAGRDPRLGAALGTLFGAATLLGVGGCFLVGVMLLLTDGFAPTPPQFLPKVIRLYSWLLLGLGILFLAAGTWVFFIGLRPLIRILRERR